MRLCVDCQIEKDESEYPKYTGTNRKVYCRTRCRPCFNAKVRQQPSQTKEARKATTIRNVYGLTMEQYNGLIKNGCEVCGTHDKLCIDHDHACCPARTKTCGKCVRGVLCDRHNRAEGMLNSNPNEAIALAMYMMRNERVNENHN